MNGHLRSSRSSYFLPPLKTVVGSAGDPLIIGTEEGSGREPIGPIETGSGRDSIDIISNGGGRKERRPNTVCIH